MEIDIENMSALLINYIGLYGLKLLAALAIFIVGRWIVKKGTDFAKKLMERAKLDTMLITFFGSILHAAGLTFVIIATLGQIGVQTASLAAVIAAAGLAVGLALQGSLSNLAAGVMIIIFRPFKVGDYIEAAGTDGTVEAISIFTTVFKTADNKTIIIPNAQITNGNITNYSAQPTRRVDMVFGIGYDDDLKKAKKILEKTVKADVRVLEDPPPQIAVMELGESSVNFVVRPWVNRADFWPVKFELTENVKLAFDKEGITIPYPQCDFNLKGGDLPNPAPQKGKKKAA